MEDQTLTLLAATCTGRCWNPAITAGQYGAIAGILAGFSFTAMVTVIGRLPDERQRRIGTERTLVTLLASFINLVSVAVLYSVLAGEQSVKRATSEEVLASAAVAPAIAVLLFGLVQFIEVQSGSLTARTFRLIVGLVLPFIGLIFVGLVVGEARYLAPRSGGYALVGILQWASPVLFLAGAAVIWWRRARFSRLAILRSRLPYLSMLHVLIAGLLFSWIWASDPDTLLPSLVIALLQLVLLAAALLFTMLLVSSDDEHAAK
jgi:hypothetical protein